MLSHFSCDQLCETLWTVACQAPLSKGFSRPEYWSGLPCPPLGDLPNRGIELPSLYISCIAGGFFITSTTWETPAIIDILIFKATILKLVFFVSSIFCYSTLIWIIVHTYVLSCCYRFTICQSLYCHSFPSSHIFPLHI